MSEKKRLPWTKEEQVQLIKLANTINGVSSLEEVSSTLVKEGYEKRNEKSIQLKLDDLRKKYGNVIKKFPRKSRKVQLPSIEELSKVIGVSVEELKKVQN